MPFDNGKLDGKCHITTAFDIIYVLPFAVENYSPKEH